MHWARYRNQKFDGRNIRFVSLGISNICRGDFNEQRGRLIIKVRMTLVMGHMAFLSNEFKNQGICRVRALLFAWSLSSFRNLLLPSLQLAAR